MKHKIVIYFLVPMLLMISMPMLGIWSWGRDIHQYLEFPPMTRYVVHQGFSRTVFGAFVLIDSALVMGMVALLFNCIRETGAKVKPVPKERPLIKFPWYGWTGIIILCVSWMVAWHRYGWAAPIQKHTFIGLWVGYILCVNGVCFIRTQSCPMMVHGRRFWLLFPVSAGFWWLFEYLNRFVQNWHYTGIETFSPTAYAALATLSFSTVLPAVYSTYWLIRSCFHPDNSSLPSKDTVPWSPLWSWGFLGGASVSLFLMGIFPNILFPLLWVSPFLLIGSMDSLFGKSKYFTLFFRDRCRVLSASSAAVVCGVFWEMWNYFSLARWEYTVPYVDLLHVFEMPLLGYGGYLPFGLECVLVCHIILDDLHQNTG